MPQPTPRGRWAAGHPVSSPLSIPAAEHPFRCEITSAIAKREYVSYVQMTRVFASQHRILSGQSGPHRLFVRSCYVFDPSQHMLPANLLTLRDRHTRRAWLRLGMLGGLAGLRRCTTASDDVRGPGFGRAKSVICVFTSGGQSQLETWDPKPAGMSLDRLRPVPTTPAPRHRSTATLHAHGSSPRSADSCCPQSR